MKFVSSLRLFAALRLFVAAFRLFAAFRLLAALRLFAAAFRLLAAATVVVAFGFEFEAKVELDTELHHSEIRPHRRK